MGQCVERLQQVECQLSRFRRGWHGGSRRPCSFPLIGKQRHRSDLFLRFEQVARQAGLEALSCPTILDSKYMPGQGRYECEYVDAKGKAHDLSLLVASGDRVWLYDNNRKPMKVNEK